MAGKRGSEGSSSGYFDVPYVPDNSFGNEHPWELDDYQEKYGFISGFAQWLVGAIFGRNNANEANATVPASQIQAEQHDFDMAELQQKYHEQNLLKDPSLQMQGYSDAGISRNAAAQAILGSQSSFAPSGSSAGVGQSQMASNVVPALLQSLINAPVAQAQAANLHADTVGKTIDNDFKPQLNQSSIDKIYGELEQNAQRLKISENELAVQKLLAQSTIDLNAAQIEEKKAMVQKLGAEVHKFEAETDLLQKYSSHEIIKMSLTKSQIAKTEQETEVLEAQEANIKADTSLKEAQTTDVETSTAGQEIENDLKSIELSLADYRYQCSQILGLPLSDDRVGDYLISQLTGNDAIYVDALNRCESGIAGQLTRYTGYVANKRNRRANRQGIIDMVSSSPSFQPTWNIRR